MALLSASLISAVAKMTIEKGKTPESRERAELMVKNIQGRIIPRLKELFEEDARIFEEVISARKRRDDPALISEKRKNTSEASDLLKKATDVLFEIVDLAFQIMADGVSIWSIGFRPAMGDAGAGISAALATVTTCLLVANVNLRSSRALWSRDAKVKCEEVHRRMGDAQDQVFSLIRQSNDETAESLRLPLPA